MKKICFLIIMCALLLMGCNKEMTVKDLKKIQVEIEDKVAEAGYYDNYSSCSIDEKEMKVVIELIDNSPSKQAEFRNNVYDSDYIIFKSGSLDEEYSETGISLEIKEETVSKNSLTATLSNNTKKEYYYGNEYYIEVLNDDQFEKIDYLNTPAWNDKLNEIMPSSSVDINFTWKAFYGDLSNGNYQIVKDVCLDKGCSEKETIYAEFTIE